MNSLSYKMKSHGQSLIEVIIAIGILSVALVGVVAGATFGLKAARVSQERGYARLLADKEMEEVRQEKNVDPEGFFNLGERELRKTDETPPGFTITTTYTVRAAGVIKVDVVVTWIDGNVTYTVEQNTILTKR